MGFFAYFGGFAVSSGGKLHDFGAYRIARILTMENAGDRSPSGPPAKGLPVDVDSAD
jgi:hypothetical protein